MLFIDSLLPNVIIAKNKHHRYIKCFVNKKIDNPHCGDKTCIICNSTRRLPLNPINPFIQSFLNQANNLDQIISGEPKELDRLNTLFWRGLFGAASNWQPYVKTIKAASYNLLSAPEQVQYDAVQVVVKQLRQIFDYDWFADNTSKPYNAYQLSKHLDRYTCTYCNRSFTSTVLTEDNKPVVRPTLDHWFPKTSHPLLAVSFYNLIPSCHPCNSSVKTTTEFTLKKNIHPYVDLSQSKDFEFNYEYDRLDGFKIFLVNTASGKLDKSRAKKTMESMKIDEVYNTNISELRDLIMIKRNYSTKYILSMQSQLKTKLSKSEVYRILFGTIYEYENFHKRPLSKFKRDMLKKLGMLDDM
ncbi:HNH endonuclease [Mucilaginibacter pocheonensis]|uniref:HNH endonuclease n=1 Tax=Mucilaginibacter pocheonensis TaxID=398050 RepID=A0ABU1TE65_9SPHI|nr:hypothetical protein [Mucilaginibacter pocheonensis]MDR6943705.1 hypothetical protein [Mucilaginibacter pocheonensis]